MGKKRAHSLDLKHRVVEHSRKSSIPEAATKFHVTRKMVRSWKLDEEKIAATAAKPQVCAKKRCRLPGGGRKLLSDEVDSQLHAWYLAELQTRNAISRRIMILKAKEFRNALISDNPELAELKLSKGWLDRFPQRHHLTMRRTTTVCQKPPEH
ncbi:tigger transposable element-derived protein 6-like [Sycon ciliatum]|uniref:tigger transposable element-derived protein 6-like n=1 Tax=Sycon ciliatum TaxID=27933 RepID=UPI0031F6B916